MDTLQKLVEIIKKNAPEVPNIVRSDTCWLDGDRCPYGQPNGKFSNRPSSFCVMPTGRGSGCQKLLDNVGEFDQMIGDLEERIEKTIDERVREKRVTLDSELRAVADRELTDVDKATLILAADIIKEIELDYKIVRTDDL